MGRKLALILVLGAFLPVSANAAVITFDPLMGSNGDPYSGHSEAGFTVNPVDDWLEAHEFGDPVPSIFSREEVGIVEVTESTAANFTFTSVGLADAAPQPGAFFADFRIDGFLGAAPVFTTMGTTTNSFQTIPSPDPTATIDLLRITMTRGSFTYNIDNIVLNEQVPPPPPRVPAPATALLLGIGLACLSVRRHR